MLHAVEPRVASHRLRRDEFPVPEDTDTPDISQPVLELSEDDRESPDKEEEEEGQAEGEEEDEEDDIPDAGAIEEEPSEGSDVSQAAPSDQASSSSSGDDPMVGWLLVSKTVWLLSALRAFKCQPIALIDNRQ